MVRDTGTRVQSGVIIGLKPSTGTRYRIELQRSTVNSTASSKWTSFFLDPTSQQFTYRDNLPLSTRSYFYRARQYGAGSTNSSFSLVVSAKPARFPDVWKSLNLPHNNLGNVEVLGGNVWVSSAKTMKVGQELSTGTLTKTLRINFGEFIPDSNASAWQYSDSDGLMTKTTAALLARAPILLPPGVQLTNFRARLYRATTAAPSTAKAFIIELTDGADTTAAGTGAVLKTMTHITKGYKTLSTGVSITMDPTKSYNLEVLLKSAVLSGGRVSWMELDYKMQTYAKTV